MQGYSNTFFPSLQVVTTGHTGHDCGWSYLRDELALVKGHVRELLLVTSSPAQDELDIC